MGKAIIYFTNCHKNLKAKYLSLATDPARAGLLDILCCLLCLLRSLVLDSRLLDGGFLLILGRAHCLLWPWPNDNLWFHWTFIPSLWLWRCKSLCSTGSHHQLFPALKQGKSLPSHLPSFTSKSSHCLSNRG